MASLFGALVLCPMVSALAFNAPQATPMADTVGLDAGIGMPQPTEAPNVQELHRRQDSNSLYLIEGPDEICGYQYGQSSKCSIGLQSVQILIIVFRRGSETMLYINMWLCNSTRRFRAQFGRNFLL